MEEGVIQYSGNAQSCHCIFFVYAITVHCVQNPGAMRQTRSWRLQHFDQVVASSCNLRWSASISFYASVLNSIPSLTCFKWKFKSLKSTCPDYGKESVEGRLLLWRRSHLKILFGQYWPWTYPFIDCLNFAIKRAINEYVAFEGRFTYYSPLTWSFKDECKIGQ